MTRTIAPATTFAILAAILATNNLSAQTLEAGYASHTVSLPSDSGQVHSLANGTIYFTGLKLVLANAQGTRDLLTFQNQVFGSFTIDADNDHILFGENQNGSLWLVPIKPGGTAVQLTTLAYNYDACLWHFGKAIVSAKTGGFGANDNELFLLDLTTGKTDLIATIPGASGPVAVDATGGVYYATASSAWPAPTGKTDILYFTGRQIHNAIGALPLTTAEAQIIYRGLDSAGSLVLDHDGDLFTSDWMNSQIVEISRGPGGNNRKSTLISYAAGNASAGGMQLVPDAHGHVGFEPFQPAGHELIVHESSWGGPSQLNHIAPLRAVTNVPSPVAAGPFDITTTDCAASGMAIVAIGFPVNSFEHAVNLGLFEQTLFWHPSMFHAFNTFSVPIDVNGTTKLSLVNPGIGFSAVFGTQTAFVSANGTIAGTAAGVNFTVR